MILAIGDLHWGGIGDYFTNEIGLSLQTDQLDAQLEWALNEGVTTVVFLGDIFDNANPTQKEVATLLDVILDDEYSDLDLHFYIGNHDQDGPNTSFYAIKKFEQFVPNLHVHIGSQTSLYKNKKEEIGLHFLPYPFTSSDEKDCIVFLHKSFRGTRRDNGTTEPDGVAFDAKKAKDYNQLYVSGHLHTMQTYYDKLIYPGTATLNRYLPIRKTYILLITPDGNTLSVKRHTELIPWKPGWLICKYSLRSQEDEAALRGLLKMKYVRVKAVVSKGFKVAKDLQEDKRVQIEQKPVDLFTKPAAAKEVLHSVDDETWIMSQLPKTIRKKGYMREKARSLIERAYK